MLPCPAEEEGRNEIDQDEADDSVTVPGAGRSHRPLGRGLEDVSHLFLSHRGGEAAAPGPVPSAVGTPPPSGSPESIALLRPAPVTRDWLAITLMKFDGALEDGLRVIDTNIPCHPCGEIDLLAVDRAGLLTIIDFDTTSNDNLLLRGIGHFDWVVQHLPNVARMYREHAVNLGLPPRLVLVAPEFSALLRSVARQITRPHTRWVRYHVVDVSGGAGILFEPVPA
jgi:hypothetical protein